MHALFHRGLKDAFESSGSSPTRYETSLRPRLKVCLVIPTLLPFQPPAPPDGPTPSFFGLLAVTVLLVALIFFALFVKGGKHDKH